MAPRSTYTQEIADEICDRLANGETLTSICRDDGMPAPRTVRSWVLQDEGPGFAAAYAHARDVGFDSIADECKEISDTPVEAFMEELEPFPIGPADENGIVPTELRVTKRKREDAIAHRRLQVDTRRWLLSKWDPKRYGDKLELAGDKNAPLTVEIVRLSREPAK